MTERRKPDVKISQCNEVKGVALNLTRSPEKAEIWGVSRSYRYGRRRCGRRDTDECRPSPRGLRQHRGTQRQASNQASDEQGLLGNSARQNPSMATGDRAVGIDGMSKEQYGEQLEENLQALSQRLRRLGYKPQPKRRCPSGKRA